MTDNPQRLIEGDATPFEARLLRAGARDSMSAASRRAITSGLGLSGGVVSLGVLGAVARRASRSLGLPSEAVRWAGGAVLSALVLGAGLELWSHSHKDTASAPSGSVAAPVEANAQPPAENEVKSLDSLPKEEPAVQEELTPPSDASRPAPSRARSARVEKTDSLADELAAIELARGALVRNNAAQSLRLLDDYTKRFPKRRLDAEATVLRIEALSVSGDRSGALRLGKAFLAKQPQGPYARRVRSLIGEPRGAGSD